MANFTSNINRVTGLGSGMDIDAMVGQIMDAESSRYESLQQKKTWISWQQTAYRDVIKSVQDFQNKWFSSSSNTSIRYSSTFNTYTSKVTDLKGNENSAIKVTSSKQNVDCDIEVKQIAVKNSYTSEKQLEKGITTSKDATEIAKSLTDTNSISLKYTLDGQTKEVSVSKKDLDEYKTANATATDEEAFVGALNKKLGEAFGQDSGKNKVSAKTTTDGKIKFSTTNGHTLSIADGSTRADSIGIKSGDTSATTEKSTLGSILGEEFNNLIKNSANTGGSDDSLVLDFGGAKVTLTSDDTVDSMMEKINASGANFKISFNSLSQTFKLEAKEGGASNEIQVTNELSKNFLKDCLGIDVGNKASSGYVAGKDAIFSIDGVETSRTSNDIEFNGLKFTITDAAIGQKLSISSSLDTDGMFSTISKFVEEYNTIIKDLNSKISETRSKSDAYGYYEPLTDAQKEGMSEDEIKKWEKEAKTGLLHNDSYISTLLNDMRSILYTSVNTSSGGKVSLHQMGITTSSDWKENGKLIIDETKLKEAINNRPGDIQELFTQAESGIGDRMNKVLNSAVGSSGSLRNKAGIENTSSVNENLLSRELSDLAKRISEEKQRLSKRETRYYQMFSNMENAMSKQNSQLESLYQLLGN